MVIRIHNDGSVEYAALGDCVLIAETTTGLVRIGIDEADAGDPWVVKALTGATLPDDSGAPRDPLSRGDLWPRLRAQRARMNTEHGYGIFSITTAPPRTVRHGILSCPAGARILLATDGLTRLVDVFGCYDAAGLFIAACERGLDALVAEVRALERADAACIDHPRAKTSDDTTGLLLRLTPAAD